MTCENNMMGSKKKSTKGMLLSVGVWMMISYSTFYASDKPIEPLIHEKTDDNLENKKNEIPLNEEDENIKKEPKEKENIKNLKLKLEETTSPTEIINNVLSEISKRKELKDCIKAIEKDKKFRVKYAGCCCHDGDLLKAKITDIEENTTKTVREIIDDVLICNDEDKSIELKGDDGTMAKKTNIYDVFEKAMNEANKNKEPEGGPKPKEEEKKEEEKNEEEKKEEEKVEGQNPEP